MPPRTEGQQALDKFAPLVAEFVGTFMLVFTAESCNLSGKAVADWAPTSIACTLMVMIYAFGNVSGGHLNPSVSLACGMTGKKDWPTVMAYIIVQIGAGVLAGLAALAVFGVAVGKGPSVQPGLNFTWWEALIVEALYTAMLCFTVLNVACAERNNPRNAPNQFYALAIGFVVVAGGYAAGGISGACFNPAVSLGLDLAGFEGGSYWGLTYCLYQVIGAAVAAILFRLVRPEEFMSNRQLEAAETFIERVEHRMDDMLHLRSHHDGMERRFKPLLTTKLAAEFIGTFMLVLTVGLNVLTGSRATAWSAAAALMVMIYSLGDVSGAHFNPAVTLAVVFSRRGFCSAEEGLLYMFVQTISGIIAGLLFAGIYSVRTFALEPKAPYTEWAAYFLETIFTFVLGYAVLSTATVKGIHSPLPHNFYYALAIGMCIVVGGVAAGGVSGGVLNPAVAFGIAVSHTINHGGLYYLLTFSIFQLAGGALAALVFGITHAAAYQKQATVYSPTVQS